MALTPLDIHNKEFSKGFRGYSDVEVDEFLDEVVREFELLLKENSALREELDALNSRVEQYRQLEDTLHNTLVVAQQTAEEVKENARKEAEMILTDARTKADNMLREKEAELKEVNSQLEILRKETKAFKAKVKSQLMMQIELLGEKTEED